jgi:chromodomain-helicase-DNA-binding protein 4
LFIYLISTKAGGLGVNLASADTVIIYDFGFNPHDEKQVCLGPSCPSVLLVHPSPFSLSFFFGYSNISKAIARAHRIGQRNKVMVYQFVTRGSMEEGMLERSKQKLLLEHLVVKKMKQGIDQVELNSLLQVGAQKLFEQENAEDEEGK